MKCDASLACHVTMVFSEWEKMWSCLYFLPEINCRHITAWPANTSIASPINCSLTMPFLVVRQVTIRSQSPTAPRRRYAVDSDWCLVHSMMRRTFISRFSATYIYIYKSPELFTTWFVSFGRAALHGTGNVNIFLIVFLALHPALRRRQMVAPHRKTDHVTWQVRAWDRTG